MLPPARQRGVVAAYASCRIADDIVDSARPGGEEAVLAQLDDWEAELTWPRHPVAIAFAATRDRYDIPTKPVHDLIEGVRSDLTIHRYASWSELETYCYHVAGTVGLIVAPILGCRNDDALSHAAGLGIAMQLTNILRDIAEDAQLGRLYLPLDELASFDLDPDAILASRPGPRLPEFLRFQIERNRTLYANALQGVSSLCPSGRLATLVASHLYAEILCEIEAMQYDVFRARARVSPARRLQKVLAATTAFARVSVGRDRAGYRESEPVSAPSGMPLQCSSSLLPGFRSRG
jgi:phytoene synthase